MAWTDDKDLAPWTVIKTSWDAESGLWKFSKTAADNRYNEGNLISDSSDPVWSADRTGDPITDTHHPCGYWTNDYIQAYILTSLMYAIEVDEATTTSDCEITEGVFRVTIRRYDMGIESTDTLSHEITEGLFRAAIHEYDYAESTDITTREVTEGVFRTAFHEYEYAESTNITAREVTEGAFRVALIKYENGAVESSNITSSEITEGTHDTP